MFDLPAGTPDAAAMAIDLLRRELMQLTAVVAEQNRLIREMHDRLSGVSTSSALIEATSSPVAEPIQSYTIGVGRDEVVVEPRRRGLGRGLGALFPGEEARRDESGGDAAGG